jgi:hypothetical protein
MKILLVFLVLMLGMAGCGSIEKKMEDKGYRELRGEELKNMVSGNTEQSSTNSYYYHAPDGTFRGVSGRTGNSNSGTWWMNGEGRLCRDWASNQWVPRGCSKIFIDEKTGDIQWYDTDGKWYPTQFHKGNIKGF